MMTVRGMGEVTFATLQDASGRIRRSSSGTHWALPRLKRFDLGDWVG